MSVMDRLFGRGASASAPAVPRDPTDDLWYGPSRSPAPAAGMPVSLEQALTIPVVFDCLQVLSQTIGALPWGMFERAADGSKRVQENHPLARVLADPNREVTSAEFFGQMAHDLAWAGDSFHEIRSGSNGPISELWRLDPSRMVVERLSDRSRRWLYHDVTGAVRRFVEGEIWHTRATPLRNDGLNGTSRVYVGREQISAALALRDYAHRFFANDCTPPFALTTENKFSDDESRENFLEAIKRWWSGKRKHSPALLEHGIKLERVGVNNEEAQFLETRKDLNHELAQLWRMPPHKVGLLERATNNNIEQQSLEFVMDTLLPWLDLIEESVRKHLLLGPAGFFFEFNVSGLLRADIEKRYKAYAQGRQWGWLSINDIRKLENMNPVAGGDAYHVPLNMQPIDSVGDTASSDRRADAEIFGPRGETVSRIFGDNVVRLKEYQNVA